MKSPRPQVKVSFWFFAAMAFAVWLGADASRLLLSAALHEAGHIAALYFFGGRIRYISLTLSGARIKPVFKKTLSIFEEAVMSAAGPAAGVLLALIAVMSGDKRLAVISAGLSLFNMLPFRGLDGYVLFSLWKSRSHRIYDEKLVKNNKAKGRFAQKQRGRIDYFNKKENRSKKVSKTR